MRPSWGDLAVVWCCFLLLLLLPFLSHGKDMPLGSTLTPGGNSAAWASPNSTFSLAFAPSPTSPSLFVAAVTYAGGISIWSAGAGAPVDSGGSLLLSSTGDLQLVNGSGAVLWSSGTAGRGVSAAALQESGSLVLKNSTGGAVWQSFDHPTDTVVMSQNFASGMNLTSGSYVFAVDRATGNLTLKWANAGSATVTYFNKGYNSTFTANRTLSSPTLTMQTNGIVSLTDGTLNAPVVVAYSSNYGESGDMLRFVRLDSDGNFRAYSAGRGSGTATEQWSAVADQCEVFGYCGNMGVCGYNGTSPVCGCPSRNFQLNDASNPRSGCRRKVELQNCPGNSTMLQLDNTQFLTYTPEITTEQFFVGITACRLNCLSGSSCVASTALSDGSGLCFLKVSNFVSAYQSASLPSTSFVKVCFPGDPNPPVSAGSTSSSRSSGLRGWVVALVVLGVVSGLVLAEWALWWVFCRNSPKYGPASAQYALLEYASGAPVQFSYRELQRSTKGFKEKLGAGGFGAVYRGVLANRTVVAVKQLEGIEQGEKQFRMEVATISSTHHLNLVRLIGFCSEGRHRLLVYEFMKNGSLDSFLFGAGSNSNDSGKAMSWATRFAVAVGTARGITYLHEECRDTIVHCDIKPENILLDEQHNAKVSDFGLAKLINPKDHRHRTLTSVRGTRGYLAPEWLANLPITVKSDVYSYGMVLLETVSGHRNFDISEETNRKKFSVWAYDEYEKGNILPIVDRRLAGEEVDMAQVERALQVSFWCIQEQPSQRPSMGKVVQMLEGIMELERPPPPKSSDSFMTVTTATTGGSASGVSSSVASTFASSVAAPPAPVPSPNVEQEMSVGRSASARTREIASLPLRSSEPYMTM
ncbi:G-type lectin S-receptor-like serine/threonine-protein kinase At1g34300 [Hordeum vulgare subsp. vulgare]|uniref:Receptor-like serine/threonine-protein kinase n=1 Tax=Hordeum vulgare subsp. vulgare TaxID=112509 RepID=A0A8I7BAF1_HORVV|nr:G-type lectin S-receptor-like serine/threonine-protein kinase At1g34300 [Hordeum vulgare subsp. vulgare]